MGNDKRFCKVRKTVKARKTKQELNLGEEKSERLRNDKSVSKIGKTAKSKKVMVGAEMERQEQDSRIRKNTGLSKVGKQQGLEDRGRS